jgi:hypothetical protein
MDRIIYVDVLEHLCVAYPRKHYTKKEALFSFEIGCYYAEQNYLDGVLWLPAHTKKMWIWYQPHPYEPGYKKFGR